MHPFLGVWGSSHNSVMRSNTALSTVTFTTSATAYNNATPVQLVASTPFDVGVISFRLNTSINNAATRSSTVFELMVGGSGSEQVFVGPVSVGYRGTPFVLNLPVFIPAGSRISVRFRSARASLGIASSIDLHQAVNRDAVGFPQRWVAYGLSDDASANAQGTIVAPGATNTWGSWTALTTSTTYAHDLWMPMVDGGTQTTMNARTTRTQFAIASTTDAATMVTNSTVWEGPTIVTTTSESVADTYFGSSTGGTFGLGAGPNGIIYAPTASGAAVSARGMCSGTVDANALGCSILAAL